jgi:hypothetical protein
MHSSMVCDCWQAPKGFGQPWFVKEKVGRSAKLYKRACKCQIFKNSEPLSTCLVWQIKEPHCHLLIGTTTSQNNFLSLFYK